MRLPVPTPCQTIRSPFRCYFPSASVLGLSAPVGSVQVRDGAAATAATPMQHTIALIVTHSHARNRNNKTKIQKKKNERMNEINAHEANEPNEHTCDAACGHTRSAIQYDITRRD